MILAATVLACGGLWLASRRPDPGGARAGRADRAAARQLRAAAGGDQDGKRVVPIVLA